MPYRIIAATCKDDGACSDVCPTKAISRNVKRKAYEINPAKCNDCIGVFKGPKCVKVCATESCVPMNGPPADGPSASAPAS